MKPNELLKLILIPILISLSIICIYDSFLQETNWYYMFESFFVNVNHTPKEFYSSVFCRGSNHTERQCSFHNLCYDPVSELFLFFYGKQSLLVGLPPDRFSPSLVDFSSVSDHNTQFFNYVEVPASAISSFNVSFIQGHALIFKRFNPNNLMHVFHDDLLPAYVTLNELFTRNSNTKFTNTFFVFADDNLPGPYSELYNNFLDINPFYTSSLPKSHLHCFQHAHVGLNKDSTWYQYGFKEPQGPIEKNNQNLPAIVNHFCLYFSKQFSIPHPQSLKNRALLLTRKQNRKTLNEDDIIRTLSNYETQTVSLDDCPILEIVQKVKSSQLIIGMHGSLLILSLFLSKPSAVIELFPYRISPHISTPYRTLCRSLGIVYRAWENVIEANSRPHPEYPPQFGGIHHLSLEEQETIRKTPVKPFLCCDNPFWLYRVYQDTEVDLESFGKVLLSALEELDESKDKSVINPLYPSEVYNISCEHSQVKEQHIILTWNEPWNLKFMQCITVEYEVWIQQVGTNEVQAFIMKQNKFAYPVEHTKTYYVWIRCYIDGRIGPFNSSPFLCDTL